MPFTFSHPAIVLPFCRSKKIKFSLTGLVIGSIVPDIEFLLRLRNTENFGHTWLGILILDVPLAIVCCFIFHGLIRNTFIVHLPKYFRQRLSVFIYFNWKKYFNLHKGMVLLSVFMGIISHIFLDAFTHRSGSIAKMNSFFYKEFIVMAHSFPVYLLLQVATSLIGAIVILWFIIKLKKGADITPAKNIARYWISIFLLSAFMLVLRFAIDKRHNAYDDILIAITGCIMYAVVIVSIACIKKSPGNIPGDQ